MRRGSKTEGGVSVCALSLYEYNGLAALSGRTDATMKERRETASNQLKQAIPPLCYMLPFVPDAPDLA
jgi:hypothetical protein